MTVDARAGITRVTFIAALVALMFGCAWSDEERASCPHLRAAMCGVDSSDARGCGARVVKCWVCE